MQVLRADALTLADKGKLGNTNTAVLSEIYRGLAAVIVGGMSVSAIFTLVFLPSLLRLGEQASTPATMAAGLDNAPVTG